MCNRLTKTLKGRINFIRSKYSIRKYTLVYLLFLTKNPKKYWWKKTGTGKTVVPSDRLSYSPCFWGQEEGAARIRVSHLARCQLDGAGNSRWWDQVCRRQVSHHCVVVHLRPWNQLEEASRAMLQATSKTIKTATDWDLVSHHLHVSKHRQLALSIETRVCLCFNWAAEERTPMWLEIAYWEVKNSICSGEAYRSFSWQGLQGLPSASPQEAFSLAEQGGCEWPTFRLGCRTRGRFSKCQLGST